jgi:DNA-binding XRE family transcriptional regulator
MVSAFGAVMRECIAPARFQESDSIHAHRRVVFPLPSVRLVFRSLRPKPYPERPQTLGEHLLKHRAKAGLTQSQVARQLRVSTGTYLLWETARTTPTTGTIRPSWTCSGTTRFQRLRAFLSASLPSADSLVYPSREPRFWEWMKGHFAGGRVGSGSHDFHKL